MSADEWALLSLYHFTTPEAARAIAATKKWVTAENTGEAYASTRVEGHATGYGSARVHVLIPLACAVLDDEFPDGEKHYRFNPEDALIISATVDAI